MSNKDFYLKQITKSLTKPKSSYAGFNLLIGLVSMSIIGVTALITLIVKGTKKAMLESKERELQKIEHDKLVAHLVSLLRSSYYDITFTPIKTNMNYDTGVVTQYVNLLIFNSSTRKIENINHLVNEVLYNTLNIECKKNDLHNTVVIVDNELEAIKEDLKKITGCDILMRCV